MFDDLVPMIIGAVVISLMVAGLRFWAPKAGARRIAERGSLVGPALKPTFEKEGAGHSGFEMQDVANRQLHDDMVREAQGLKLRARTGTSDERIATLDRAISKVYDALTARAGSFEGTKLLAELHLAKGMLTEGVEAVAPLQLAAELFADARDLRKGVIDNYLGRGWAYLQMARMDPHYAAVYAQKAAEALAAGFERVPQNVWILRGWGLATDRYARAPNSDPARLAEMEAAYRTALSRHRNGSHDLFDWYDGVRAATEPVWVDVPPIGD